MNRPAARPGAGRLVRRRAASVWVVAGLAAVVARSGAATAQLAGGPPPRFGVAHADLMDLHVERVPGGGLRDRELLPAPDVADRFAKAAASGAAWNRWSLYWDMVERTPGAFQWSAADGIVRRDVGAGLASLVILQGTPGFHATGGLASVPVPKVGGPPRRFDRLEPHADSRSSASPVTPVQASPPRGLGAPIFRRAGGGTTDDPAEAASVNADNPWAVFVDAGVRRYRPDGELARAEGWPAGAGVRAWEVGNEPNLPFFWSGTPAEFARYLEVAYLVIEWQDPAATVVHGGIADDSEAAAWYGRFADALKARAAASPLPARHGYYFDKAGWHWYTYPSLLQTGPARARTLLTGRGIPEKPIWVTEMGVPIWSEHPGPCWDPASPWRATAAEQAGYAWQAFAEGVASDVEAMIHFQLYDDCGNGPASYDAFGLVRNHASNQCWAQPEGQACWRYDPALAGVPRPAFAAFRTAVDLLGRSELLWRPAREADFWQRVLFYLPPDRRVTVAWNLLRADRSVALGATGPEATIHSLDADGALAIRTAAPVDGRHAVTLPGATNRNNPGSGSAVMAGRPVILVERDAYAPFRSHVEPLPAQSPAAFDLAVAAADGGTGVGAYEVLVATEEPADPRDWRVLVPETAWPAAPLGATIDVPFTGEPGRTYYFAARARDRAGNWTSAPASAQAGTRIVGTAPSTPTPGGPTAVPTASPAATRTGEPTPVPTSPPATVTVPPPTETRGPTATQVPTATQGPVVATLHLPLVQSRYPSPGRPVTQPAPCVSRLVEVRGPRGDRLADGVGRWRLAAWRGGAVVGDGDAPVGEPICVAPGDRLAASADVPGYAVPPPQDIGKSTTLHLAALPEALANGSFERPALEGWTLSGSTPPRATGSADALGGDGAVVLGEGFRGQPELGGGGNSTLRQAVDVPAGRPTLSLDYRFDSRATCAPDCRRLDRIEVIVVGRHDPEQTAHYLTGPDGLREPAERWSHLWYDLAPWAGQPVTIILNLYQPDAVDPSRAWLDNVAVGPAAPAERR